jgi:hypothetical protein
MKETYPTAEDSSDKSKTRYFSHLAGSLKSAMRLHYEQGLWERTPEGTRDWGNVTEHCLVEAARVGVMADQLGLQPETKRDLQLAAGLHDFYKKGEVQLMKARGLSWESYDEAGQKSTEIILAAGFSERVAYLASSVGHSTLNTTEALVTKPDLTEDDKAYLAMHYCDDYTVDAQWALPAEADGFGNRINDLDRRMDKNNANKRYEVINEAGREHFNGERSYDAQRRVGHLVEDRLAGLMGEQMGIAFDPIDLPVVIDNQIRADIVGFVA